MSTLPLVPLDDIVVFPGMNLTLAIDAGAEDEVLLVPRKDEEFASVGTVAQVHERLDLPGGGKATTFEAVRRGVAGAARTDLNGDLRIEITPHEDPTDRNDEIRALEREYRAVVEEILDLRNADDRIRAFLRSINEPGALADTAGYSPDLSYEQKVELLETLDVQERLTVAVAFQRERLAELDVRSRIRDDVQSGAEKQQREYFLRKQMDSIRKELGEDDASVADEYRKKIEESGMPEDVREQAERE
ncbi:MAG: LON peptidase substrate-binding domain-containing protein, partial [Solirubrobacterales bacterium]|nr:LON peptidase substrate-binding domain-containing protein [Solirubrobacterales bacterium]